MFQEDLSVLFSVFKDPAFLDPEMSTQWVQTYRCKYSISVFLSSTISEIYIIQSPNCKSASSSKMLVQNLYASKKKVLLKSKHVPLISVKLKCRSIFVTECSFPVPYRVWKIGIYPLLRTLRCWLENSKCKEVSFVDRYVEFPTTDQVTCYFIVCWSPFLYFDNLNIQILFFSPFPWEICTKRISTHRG